MQKIVLVFAFLVALSSCAKKPVYPEARFDGQDVRIAVDGMKEKEPQFFTFRDGDRSINYFVVKVDGSVQSYFDACAKCYPKKLGYRLERGRVVCRACDVHYGIEDLKDGIGSCYPIKLRGRIDRTTYVISKKDILAGGRYF